MFLEPRALSLDSVPVCQCKGHGTYAEHGSQAICAGHLCRQQQERMTRLRSSSFIQASEVCLTKLLQCIAAEVHQGMKQGVGQGECCKLRSLPGSVAPVALT